MSGRRIGIEIEEVPGAVAITEEIDGSALRNLEDRIFEANEPGPIGAVAAATGLDDVEFRIDGAVLGIKAGIR